MDSLADTFRRRRVKHLLLIYLFVVKAAADCPKPQGVGSIVLTNEALLMNNFPDNITITFECSNGYTIVRGSGISVCQSGIWSEPDLICKKKDCGLPKPQPNMRFNISDGTLFGAVIKVECDPGYQVSGNSYKQCFDSGWKGKARCEIVTCEKPEEVVNGRNSWDSEDYPIYGAVIQYTCNEGYTLNGRMNVVCSEHGEYDFPPPECRGSTTGDEITPKLKTTTSTTPQQDAPADSAATLTTRRDNTITSSATPTISPSPKGSRGILAAEDKASTASPASTTWHQVDNDGAVDLKKYNGYTVVTLCVISVVIAVLIIIAILYKRLLRRKGSYDTREDLKPELLRFQNL